MNDSPDKHPDLIAAEKAAGRIAAGLDTADGGYNDYHGIAKNKAHALFEQLHDPETIEHAKKEIKRLTDLYANGSGTSGMVLSALDALRDQKK